MNELRIKTCRNIRVLTTQQLAESYETDTQVITNNFNRNKERYSEGKHFICLTGDDLREFRAKNQNDVLPNANKLYLWTEKGTFLHAKSLNTDVAWEVYERLMETYFNAQEAKIAISELSPELQMFNKIFQTVAQQEIEQKRQAEQLNRIEKQQAVIREAIQPVTENWREEMGKKIRTVQYSCGRDFKELTSEMYKELEQRASCNLSTRLRNKRQRMEEAGCTKTAINNARKIDIIEENAQLRSIFEKIVSEYVIHYCA